MSEPVHLKAQWSREPVPSGTTQINYVLIEAQPTQVLTNVDAPPLNFCLVLDRSGSMAGANIQNMKRAVQDVLTKLRPQDVVSIVLFDDTLQVLVPAQTATDIPALQNAVERIVEQGGTAMSLGLQAGLDELKKHQSEDRSGRMLVLTDGQTWGDEDTCRDLARQIGAIGVPITALGLGDEWNEELLDELASASAGDSDYIAKPEDIGRFFQQTLQTAQMASIKQARVLLRLLGDVNPRAVFRVTPRISNLGYTPINDREVSVDLGEIGADGASILVDLMLPERDAGMYRIAQVELTYDAPALQVHHGKVKLDVPLNFTTDADRSTFNPALMNTVEKVTAFKLQTRALSEAEAGNMVGATQKLRAAATRLLDMGEVDLAQTMEDSAEALEKDGQISSADQKQLKYATRRLTQRLEN